MKQQQTALRLTVYLAQGDRLGETPVYVELVARAHKAGLAGATVVRDSEGFGSSTRIHPRLQGPHSVVIDAPLIVTIVDTPEKMQAFAASVADLAAKGLAILQAVEMITFDNP